jgi:hypothetical protein
MAIEQLDELGEVGQRAGETVDLVDNDSHATETARIGGTTRQEHRAGE